MACNNAIHLQKFNLKIDIFLEYYNIQLAPNINGCGGRTGKEVNISMSNPTAEERQRAHNEGEQWAKDDHGLGFSVSGFLHELSRSPSDVKVRNVMDTERTSELHDAFEKGVSNFREQKP